MCCTNLCGMTSCNSFCKINVFDAHGVHLVSLLKYIKLHDGRRGIIIIMNLTGAPTPKIDWESTNLHEQWKKIYSHVKLIFTGPLHEKDEEIKVTYLLLWVGDKDREIINTWFDMTADDRKK